MYSRIKFAQKYLNYWLKASNGKGHGTHSPFVYDFIDSVLNDGHYYESYDKVEALRERLLKDQEILAIEDFGAGSAFGSSPKRSIAQIARQSSKSRKLGRLLFRVSHYYQPKFIVELGTSLGLSTAYLSLGNPEAKLITVEGSDAIAREAAINFESMGLENIQLMRGQFDDTLPEILDRFNQPGTIEKAGLVFIDGNHRKAPTIKYFNAFMGILGASSVLIIDDIHWSEDMEAAWTEIIKDSRVMLSIDLFQIGLIFKRDDFKVRQHFIIRF